MAVHHSHVMSHPELVSKVSELEKSLNYLHEHVKSQDKHISQCLQNEKETAALLLKLQRDHSDLVKYTGTLEEYCLELDIKCRKKHLILTGIEESQAECKLAKGQSLTEDGTEMETEDANFKPTHAVAFSTLQTIFETLVYDDLDVAYRIGKKGPSPRPIVVKFVKEHIRNEVNRRRSNLKDSDETKQAFLNEDLPAKSNQQRADLRCIVNHAKSKNVHAKNLGDKILIDNKIYSYKDIDRLPEGLKISDAKMIDTPRGIAFQSHYAFLSNFFPTPVKFNGLQFASAEHAYQHNRALFLGNLDAAYNARIAKTPQEAKREGARLLSSKEWDSCKMNVMRDIVFAKFSQSKTLQTKLLETGDRPLIEAAFDSYWGSGLPLTARKMIQGDWHGRNVLGAILVDCRAFIRREKLASNRSSLGATQSSTNPPQSTQMPQLSAVKSRHVNKGNNTKTKQSSSPSTAVHLRQSHSQNLGNQSHSTSTGVIANSQSFPPLPVQNQYQNQNQQSQMWSNPMMFQQQQFPFPNPYYMYPPMQVMPNQPAYPHPQPATSTGAQYMSTGALQSLQSPPPNVARPPFPTHTSPYSSASDAVDYGERRIFYDPYLSPEVHV